MQGNYLGVEVVERRRDVVGSQVEVEGKMNFSEEGREVEKKYPSLAWAGQKMLDIHSCCNTRALPISGGA